MGIEYTVILQDDFDWSYVNTDKSKVLEDIVGRFKEKGYPEPRLVGSWYGFMVLEIGKVYPQGTDLFNKKCDSWSWWSDTDPYEIRKGYH